MQRRPGRVRGGVHDVFWDFTARGELRMQRCGRCRQLSWPPTDEPCEWCGGAEFRWERLSGAGEVVSWSTFHQRYYTELDVPWCTILVRLAEGPLMISNPLDFGEADCAAGMQVELAFESCFDDSGDFALPVFRRASGRTPQTPSSPQPEETRP